jgi:hypothetical protein
MAAVSRSDIGANGIFNCGGAFGSNSSGTEFVLAYENRTCRQRCDPASCEYNTRLSSGSAKGCLFHQKEDGENVG